MDLEQLPETTLSGSSLVALLNRMPLGEAITTMLELPETFGPITRGVLADTLTCSLKTIENGLPLLLKSGRIEMADSRLVLPSPRPRPDLAPTSPRPRPEIGGTSPRPRPDLAPKSGNNVTATNKQNSTNLSLGVGGVGGGVFKDLELDVKDVDLEVQNPSQEHLQLARETEQKPGAKTGKTSSDAPAKTGKPKKPTAHSVWATVEAPDGLDAMAWQMWLDDLEERTGKARSEPTTGRLLAQAKKLIKTSSGHNEPQHVTVSRAIEWTWQSFHGPRDEEQAPALQRGPQRTQQASTRTPRDTDQANDQLGTKFNRILDSVTSKGDEHDD